MKHTLKDLNEQDQIQDRPWVYDPPIPEEIAPIHDYLFESDESKMGKRKKSKRISKQRSNYNTGLKYSNHNDEQVHLDVVYESLHHKDRLYDLASRHGIKYNSIRNIINQFKNEKGLKYKHQPFDIFNPILISNTLRDQAVIEGLKKISERSFPFLFL